MDNKPLDAKQLEVLEITQEVLRGAVIALMHDLPHDYVRTVAARLQGWSQRDDLSPQARAMLSDLAEGVERIPD
jgi:hypothetical protein